VVGCRGDKEVERTPQSIVIDASTALKWFVPEEDTEKAVKLRNRHVEGENTLFAPDLLTYEVANALKFRNDIIKEDLVKDIDALFNLDLELIVPSSEMIIKSMAIARKLDITVYDSIYLTLAETIGAYVVTSDEKLYEKTKQTKLIQLLKDWSK